jgi:hypothetical protein
VIETRPGVPLQPDVLDRDMRRLFGTGDFEHVNYRLVREGDQRILDIQRVEKSWGPGYLRFGLGLSYDFKGNALFDLAASYRRTWLDSLGAEWRTDVQIGRNSLLRTAWYQPLATRATCSSSRTPRRAAPCSTSIATTFGWPATTLTACASASTSAPRSPSSARRDSASPAAPCGRR